ncbi:hypothetical protein ACFQ3S_02990 [Mucilaginibacter terrae]|uniref:hypothetical protein n=1 Tax=Mucilaginibacter terrae TaxID=1955052 RepID=UPI003638CB4F
MIDIKHYLYLLLGSMAIVASCSSPAKKTEATAPMATAAPQIMIPFRFHKTIEVAPGQYYDVLAWGRGSQTVGAFEILRSDSATMKYTTTTGDLEGSIKEVLNADMDTDGNPEIFIHTQATDSTNAAKIYAFEYNNDKARELDFPRLTRSQKKGYRGNDNFFVKDGNLMREFNVYDETDSLATKPIDKRSIRYSLRGNNISANQISTDTATVRENSIAPVAVESNPSSSQSGSNSGSTGVRKKSTVKTSANKSRSLRKKQVSKKRRRRSR